MRLNGNYSGFRRSVSAFALALACSSVPAFAQDANAPADNAAAQQAPAQDAQAAQDEGENGAPAEIVVTGSRIARPEFDTVQPTQVLGAAQIENRGYTNVG